MSAWREAVGATVSPLTTYHWTVFKGGGQRNGQGRNLFDLLSAALRGYGSPASIVFLSAVTARRKRIDILLGGTICPLNAASFLSISMSFSACLLMSSALL